MKKIVAVLAVMLSFAFAANAQFDVTDAADSVKEAADTAVAKVESKKAENAARVEAKKAERKKAKAEKKAAIEAKKAEKKQAVEDTKACLKNLKDSFGK